MEAWQKEAILRHRIAVLNDLDVDYILDHLLAHQILSEDNREGIYTQKGKRNRARYLLDLLPSLGPTAYLEFIASLKEPYPWIADILSKEIKTTTNVASTSQYSISESGQNQEQVPLNPEEITQLLTSLASVASTCGKTLCAIGDAVTTIVQSMKNTPSFQSSNLHVSRHNSINVSKNEQQILDDSGEIKIDRLRGGGDINEDKTLILEKEKTEVPPSSLPLPANSLDLNEAIPSKNIDCDPEKIEGIATVEKIIDLAYVHEDTVDGLFAGVSVENVEQIKTSHAKDVLYNDSPDSGITGDGDVCQLQGGIASLVIMQQNGTPSFDEDFENFEAVKVDQSVSADNLLMMPSRCSQWMIDKDSNSGLHPVLNEMQTLQQSLADMTVALRAIVQISERAFKSVGSIQS